VGMPLVRRFWNWDRSCLANDPHLPQSTSSTDASISHGNITEPTQGRIVATVPVRKDLQMPHRLFRSGGFVLASHPVGRRARRDSCCRADFSAAGEELDSTANTGWQTGLQGVWNFST